MIGEIPISDACHYMDAHDTGTILKESNPVQVGVYVIACGIQDEPVFAWWVPYVMRKRDIIVLMVKSRVRRTTHKHGIEMPAPGRDIVQNAIDLG